MRYPALLAPAALALIAAACDGGGGTGSDNVTAAEVAGVYSVCQLRFAPSNQALPTADLLQAVIDTTPPAGRPEATVSLSTNGTYDLVYTRQGDAFLQQLRGSISYGRQSVTLSVAQNSEIGDELLLSRPLTLGYTSGPTKQLAGLSPVPYAVDRGDYARAANISEEGLQNTINGSLTAAFSAGSC